MGFSNLEFLHNFGSIFPVIESSLATYMSYKFCISINSTVVSKGFSHIKYDFLKNFVKL